MAGAASQRGGCGTAAAQNIDALSTPPAREVLVHYQANYSEEANQLVSLRSQASERLAALTQEPGLVLGHNEDFSRLCQNDGDGREAHWL